MCFLLYHKQVLSFSLVSFSVNIRSVYQVLNTDINNCNIHNKTNNI